MLAGACLPDSRSHVALKLAAHVFHNQNDDTKGAFRVTLRAIAKPGLALSWDGWRPKPRRGRRSNVQTTQRQRRGRPPPTPSPGSRSSRDGWLPKPQHDRRPRVLVHRLCAFHPAHPVKLSKMALKRAQQRWTGLQPALTHIAKQVRARLGDALWANFVTNAYVGVLLTPSLTSLPRGTKNRCDDRCESSERVRGTAGRVRKITGVLFSAVGPAKRVLGR